MTDFSSPPAGWIASSNPGVSAAPAGYTDASYVDGAGVYHSGFVPVSTTKVGVGNLGTSTPPLTIAPSTSVGGGALTPGVSPIPAVGSGATTGANTANSGLGSAWWEIIKRVGVVGLGLMIVFVSLFWLFASATVHEYTPAKFLVSK
jgi:hypothetical protein